MLRKFNLVVAVLFVISPSLVYAASKSEDKPQVIKLQRFRKALWKVHVTIKGKQGDFLLDTGGGVTFVTDAFAKGIDCRFWGRTTGYNMFGKRSDGGKVNNAKDENEMLRCDQGDEPVRSSGGLIFGGDHFFTLAPHICGDFSLRLPW